MDIKEIRKHKGKSFVGIATAAAIFNKDGKLLLAKRSENCRDEHNTWDICGGGLEVSSTIEQNLRAEMNEELNISSSQPVYFVGIHEAFRIDQHGDKTHWLSLDHVIILTDEDIKEVKINEPKNFKDLGWFDLSDLPQPLHSQLSRGRINSFKLKFEEAASL